MNLEEKTQEEKDQDDLRDLVRMYRTLKDMSRFMPWILGIILVLVSICAELLKILREIK